jgi:Tfp pilus assembly protein PilF
MATKNLPKSADARFGLALARMLQGALDDALEHLDAALKLDPHYLPATQKRGEIYQMRGANYLPR